MKTAVLASGHYFAQRENSPDAIWFNLDSIIETEEKYQRWLDFAIPLFEENKISRIFGLTDLTALVAAHCEFLLGVRDEEKFIAVVNCLNKPWVRQTLGNASYNVKETKDFPAFIKPIHSSLSQGTGYIKDHDELLKHLGIHTEAVHQTTSKYRVFGAVANTDITDNFHKFYIEECIESGTQLTVDVLAHDGSLKILSVSETVFHKSVASFDYFDFPYNCSDAIMDEIHNASLDIAKKLQLDNLLFNIEFIYTDAGKLKLVEINPRPATQFLPAIKSVYGFDGWHYLNTGVAEWKASQSNRLAIKILRTTTDSIVKYTPPEDVLDILGKRLNAKFNSFVKVGTKLSDYQQDGLSYRVGEIYIPYESPQVRDAVFKRALTILEAEEPLLAEGAFLGYEPNAKSGKKDSNWQPL